MGLFILGFIIGGTTGVLLMALVSAKKEGKDADSD